MRKKLFDDYAFEEIERTTFNDYFAKNRAKVFTEDITLSYEDTLSSIEKENRKTLFQHTKERQMFCFFIYKKDEIIGWHFGKQIDHEEYYMINTAIYEQYRNNGVYQAFLKEIILFLKEKGYQLISSKHHASNNAVLVPKLKAGFYIKALEIDINFGTMVRLVFFVNDRAKEIYFYRTGYKKLPD